MAFASVMYKITFATMHPELPLIDSQSVGDPARFQTCEDLERALAQSAAPKDKGSVVMMVSRLEGGLRHILEQVRLEVNKGMPGDAWERRGRPNPDASLTAIQSDMAALMANGQPLELSGDNLYLDLDLSNENLPTGSRVRLGDALLEVTPKPHDGCKKFRARFGDGALRFASKPELRHRNLRGIYMRVIEAGEVRAGDRAEVVSRAKTLSDVPVS